VTEASDRPIFVVGCPRSGTTLLQLMLSSHPRIAIPPETRFLLRAYARRLEFGDLEQPANRRVLGEFICARRGHRFRDLGLKRRRTVEEIVAGPPTLGSAFGIVYQAYAARFGKPRWGDKRPAYNRYLDILLRLFPDAQLVHLVRDPRDCVASLKRVPWWRRGPYQAVVAWAGAIDNVRATAERHPDAVVELQYERLVADPETELRRLCTALGEDFNPAMATPESVASLHVPERALKEWHANTRRRPSTASVGRWREELEPWEAGLCETVLGARMDRFGYERSGDRVDPFHRLAYAAVSTRISLTDRVWAAREQARRRREPNPVAARLTAGQLAVRSDAA